MSEDLSGKKNSENERIPDFKTGGLVKPPLFGGIIGEVISKVMNPKPELVEVPGVPLDNVKWEKGKAWSGGIAMRSWSVKMAIYMVEQGDTINSIAKKFKIDAEYMVSKNSLHYTQEQYDEPLPAGLKIWVLWAKDRSSTPEIVRDGASTAGPFYNWKD